MHFIGYVFLKNLVWTQFLHPRTWKFGFLVENYVYSLIPRSKLDNLGQNTSLKKKMLKNKFWGILTCIGEFQPGNKTIYVVFDEESEFSGPRTPKLSLDQVFLEKRPPEKNKKK